VTREVAVVWASEIEFERVRWLEPNRVALSTLTLVAGMPDQGKTLWLCHLAARVSRGEADGEPGTVLFAAAEDSIRHTPGPRLEAAGADLSRVGFLTLQIEGTEAGGLTLPADANSLAARVEETGAKLLLIDPLMSHVTTGTNMWRDEAARTVTTPLHQIAETYGCAVVASLHVNKRSEADPLVRFGGSLGGIVGPARNAFLWAADPDDEESDRRIMAHVKHNLGPRTPSAVYEIEEQAVPIGGEPARIARVVPVGESQHTGQSLLTQRDGESNASAVDEAVKFLEEELRDGPLEAAEIRKRATQLGISKYALNQAKKRLGVENKKEGYAPSRWVWILPVPIPLRVRVAKGSTLEGDDVVFRAEDNLVCL
jgi:hypothetical protein